MAEEVSQNTKEIESRLDGNKNNSKPEEEKKKLSTSSFVKVATETTEQIKREQQLE